MKKSAMLLATVALSLVACNGHDPKAPTTVARDDNEHAALNNGQVKESDRLISDKIKQVLKDHKDLSDKAKAVKVVSVDGVVTIYGPVTTQQEKELIIRLISDLAAQYNIKQLNSQIEIAQ